MTLKQLILNNTWPTISTVFIETYPDSEKSMAGYKTVFTKLVLLNPEETDISIVITKEKDGDEEYIDVSGLHNHPRNKEETYSQGIEFTPWRKWLGMDISKESLNDFSEAELIVHCLYEMTFEGFEEEDIENRIISIDKSRMERESLTEEESEAIAISVEEILNVWRDNDID